MKRKTYFTALPLVAGSLGALALATQAPGTTGPGTTGPGTTGPGAARVASLEPGASAVLTAGGSGASDELDQARGFVWDARTAQHLLNRAGFGARPAEIRAALRVGPEVVVDQLLAVDPDSDPYFIERYAPNYRGMREMSDQDREREKKAVRRKERKQVENYVTWWYERLLSGEDPLQERMVLFWHGFFTSSPMGVRRSFELLNQNALVRENALGSYAVLLREMARDPAMLMYLDNHVNRKGQTNENFARELMEIFSLGEGNYTEDDVKEAARALTGRASNGEGEFVFRKRQHDGGMKTILGRKGRWDGDALVDILLEQPACARWVSLRLITYFEGVEPDPDRLERYASILRDNDYEVKPFLRTLLLDPEFYRAETIGTRIASPVDYLVGTSRRLGVEPPGVILHQACGALGQKLLNPPNVKGWEEGLAWITTSTLMQRGNFAGMMLGVVDPEDVISQDDVMMDPTMDPTMDGGMDPAMGGMEEGEATMERGQPTGRARTKAPPQYAAWKRAHEGPWRAGLNLSARMKRVGARSDEEIVDALAGQLLAVGVDPVTRTELVDYLAHERRQLGIVEGNLLTKGKDGEYVLRRLSHLMLSLPEAQLM